jgi:hypothetical protein
MGRLINNDDNNHLKLFVVLNLNFNTISLTLQASLLPYLSIGIGDDNHRYQ